jgi:tetratricopeptide (TPR) repeat protein
MTNISLRDYYKEVDALINQGRFLLAIEHCKNILNTYPKDFEVYRLMGKAYIENKDYAQAADSFERALAIRPDDFIANVGMSSIREEEGNLNAAIWHMERAFELDSSNVAIQEELKRLYNERDGEAPQKIRLTKGALIRMYLRGGMLQQAISEIQMKFPSGEERLDIQILLAGLYAQTGQKSAAVDLCQNILKKLPYSFDANLILLNTLPSPAKDLESSIYRDRLIEMDPYFAYVNEPGQNGSSIPDDAVILKVMETDASETESEYPHFEAESKMPAWFSEESNALQRPEISTPSAPEPVEPAESTEFDEADEPFKDAEQPEPVEQPERDEQPETVEQPEIIEPAPEEPSPMVSQNGTSMVHPEIEPDQPVQPQPMGENTMPDSSAEDLDLPDWMKDAGWKPEVSPEDLNIAESQAAAANITPADIPDWVQNMAPESLDTTESAFDLAGKNDLSEILFDDMEEEKSTSIDELESALTNSTDIGHEEIPATPPAEETSSIPEWLQGFNPTQPEAKEPDKPLPEWLDFDEKVSSNPENNPFTLDSIPDMPLDKEDAEGEQDFPGTAPLSPESLPEFEKPEWLKETQAEAEIDALFSSQEKPAQSTDDFSNWLENLRPDSSEADSKAVNQGPASSDNLPDWLKEPEPQIGDTEPVAIKREDIPDVDVWKPEHTEPAASEVANAFDSSSFEPPSEIESGPATNTGPGDEFTTPEKPDFQFEVEKSSSNMASVFSNNPPAATALPEKNNVEALINYYNQQLRQGANIPGLITELKKLTSDYPAEAGIWLVLGDAYHHDRQIQAALDAYARAEEFLS